VLAGDGRLMSLTGGPFFYPDGLVDPGVAFHGTSSCFESLIDSKGLQPDRGIDLRDAVVRLVQLFKELDWDGRTLGSRSALENFTHNHDLSFMRGKPVYLVESSVRASTFAMRDFAGGECARGLRKSFDDLRAYIDDPSLCAKHRETLTSKLQAWGHPSPRRTAEERLANYFRSRITAELDARAGFERAVSEFPDKHQYGLIYALRLPSVELCLVEENLHRGFRASGASAAHANTSRGVRENASDDEAERPVLVSRAERRSRATGFTNIPSPYGGRRTAQPMVESSVKTPGLLHAGGTGCRTESSLPHAATTGRASSRVQRPGRARAVRAPLMTDRPLSLLETGSRLTGADGYRRAMAVRPGVARARGACAGPGTCAGGFGRRWSCCSPCSCCWAAGRSTRTVARTASCTSSSSEQAEAALPSLSRTTIVSERAQVKRLALGYRDDVSIFLNGKVLFGAAARSGSATRGSWGS
jgi:hypothetical protein